MADEHVLIRDRPDPEQNGKTKREMIVYKTREMKDIMRLVKREGWVYRNRCKMMVTYPGEISPVWMIIDAKPSAANDKRSIEET